MQTAAIDRNATERRQRRPQQRAEDTRERILGAAIREFASGGFDGVSTRAVAEAAGVRHALVTYHFQGKDGLWRAALDRTVRGFVEGQRARSEGLRGVDDAQKLRLLLEDCPLFGRKQLSSQLNVSCGEWNESPARGDSH